MDDIASGAVVGIVTADRPAACERCMRALLSRSAEGQGGPGLIVSSNGADSYLPSLCKLLGKEYQRRVHCHDRPAQKALSERLVALGADREVLDWATGQSLEPAIGANRNSLLLKAAGRPLISVDDDVVAKIKIAWSGRHGLKITKGYEPRAFDFPFGKDRSTVKLMASNAPLCSFHRNLGATVSGLLGCAENAGQPVETMPGSEWAKDERRQWRVRLTMSGLRGHDAMGWPTRLLFLHGQARDRLLRSEEFYRHAYMNARMTRYVEVPTITPTVSCMTTCIGFDAQRLLPPFIPGLRSGDTLYGITLAKSDIDAAVMFTPDVVEHLPLEPRRRSSEDIWSHARMRLTHLLAQIINMAPIDNGVGASGGLSALGTWLERLGCCSVGEIREVCVSCWRKYCAERLATIEGLRLQFGFAPAFWDEDICRHARQIETSLRDSENAMPIDFQSQAADGWSDIQSVVMRFGRLLREWPSIWALATQLNVTEP